MLEAYMDESGIHDGAHACVVAGYWGGERRWREFEPRWKEILKNAGGPTLKEFHSTDFWKPDGSRKGVFKKWTDAKADKFISDLLECIGRHGIYPTSSVLVVSEWSKLNKNERRFLTGGKFDSKQNVWIAPSAPNQTYYLPFQFAVMAPALACQDHLTVHYVFDLHKQFKSHASNIFALLKKNTNLSFRQRLGEFTMAPGEDAPGLQAADLLAYQTYQQARKRLLVAIPTRISQLPWILRGALKRSRSDEDHLFFDGVGIREALQDLPEHIRNSSKEFPLKLMK